MKQIKSFYLVSHLGNIGKFQVFKNIIGVFHLLLCVPHIHRGVLQ